MLEEIVTSQEKYPSNDYCDRLAKILMNRALFVSELKHVINKLHGKKETIPEEKIVMYVSIALFELTTDEALELSAIKKIRRTSKVNLEHFVRAILTRGTKQREQLIRRIAQLTIA